MSSDGPERSLLSHVLLPVAAEVDASAVAFRPRKGELLTRLLSGDRSARLITEATLPVISLPDAGDAADREGDE